MFIKYIFIHLRNLFVCKYHWFPPFYGHLPIYSYGNLESPYGYTLKSHIVSPSDPLLIYTLPRHPVSISSTKSTKHKTVQTIKPEASPLTVSSSIFLWQWVPWLFLFEFISTPSLSIHVLNATHVQCYFNIKSVLNTIYWLGFGFLRSSLHICILFRLHIDIKILSQVCSAWYDLNVDWMFCGNGLVELKIIRYTGIEGYVSSHPVQSSWHYNNCQEEALISHCAEASLRNWITKNCDYVPCYQKPERVFYDLAALTLPYYEWQWSPVQQSWKYTFRKHNKKMKCNDKTQFI